jgi:hypothetical protein
MTVLLRITIIAAVLYGFPARAEDIEEPGTRQQQFALILGGAFAAQKHCGLKDVTPRAMRFIDFFNSGFSMDNLDDAKLTVYYKIAAEAAVKQMGEHSWCVEYLTTYKQMFSLGD